MRAEDKERLARRQRMLARERGETLPEPEPEKNEEKPSESKVDDQESAVKDTKGKKGRERRVFKAEKKKDGAAKAAASEPKPTPQPSEPPQKKSGVELLRPEGVRGPRLGNTRPFSPILRRRARRRRLFLVAVVLALLVALAWVTGVLGASISSLGDVMDSVSLYFQRSGGWPAATGIEEPTRIEELAGGFVELDKEDVAVYSAYGTQVRTLQPGYTRPALAVGNTRFVLYDRSGTSLQVESRTRTLYTKTFTNAIMLCAMSPNGTVGVVTESERYAAELQVFSPTMRGIYSWKMTQDQGIPLVMEFASDNHRFAMGTVAARDGQLACSLYLMDTAQSETGPLYTADKGSLLLQLHWLSTDRVLAVFDTYAAVVDAATGQEMARYDYGGANLQGASVHHRTTALLLSTHSGNELVVLNDSMQVVGQGDAGQAEGVTCADTAVYLWGVDTVSCYELSGSERWSQVLNTRPQAVLNANQPLLFTAGRVEVLYAPL